MGVYYFAIWLRRYVLTSKHQSLSGISFTQRPIDPLQPHTDCQRAQEYYTTETDVCEVFIALPGDASFILRHKAVGFQRQFSIKLAGLKISRRVTIFLKCCSEVPYGFLYHYYKMKGDKKMATTLFQTKSRVAAQLLSRTIAYLEKDPEANFPGF
ncbi:hypothetical protein [Desulfofundulus australicus]|nr:hypothetical protein [Desulfofundulus australicus]